MQIVPAITWGLLNTMILTFTGLYGSTVDLNGSGEIQGYEFLQPPIEYRFLRAGAPVSDWMTPEPRYISLLRPVRTDNTVKTRGLDRPDLSLETRGLAGTFTLLVWPRE